MIGGFWIELARSGEQYFVPEGKKVLEVLYEAGVDVDYSCELGICAPARRASSPVFPSTTIPYSAKKSRRPTTRS
jgi:hypothetical protein